MALFNKKTSNPSRLFNGSWADRLDGLFELNVDFTGKRVLDIGCNMGIVSYEVSKFSPALIDGCDLDPRSIEIANAIFQAVRVDHNFSVVNLARLSEFRRFARPEYDVVLYLAVDQHVRRQEPEGADALVKDLIDRCRESFVFRGPPASFDIVSGFLAERGFAKQADYRENRTINAVTRFDRSVGDA